MSADDILKLSSGEKLDSLVAIEVMDGKPGRYSTDIRDAWRVVKKIASLGWRVDILYSSWVVKVNALKLVSGKPYSIYAKYGSIVGETAPEAICKLALLVMKVEKEGWD